MSNRKPPAHAHHWILGQPDNGQTEARCKRCRATRVFQEQFITTERYWRPANSDAYGLSEAEKRAVLT